MADKKNADINDFGSKVPVVPQDRKERAHITEDCDEAECESEGSEKTKYKSIQWTLAGENVHIPCGETQKQLKPDIYSVNFSNNIGVYFSKIDIKVDEIIEFKDDIYDTVLTEIEMFWDKANLFKEYKFLHRRGYLFYGPAGSGKTCLVNTIMKKIINRGGIVFIDTGNPALLIKGLQKFREVEPDRNIVCIFEDIDDTIERRGETEILSYLDGENQIDKVVNIATTNYPEKLDKRIVARPRRFDRFMKIDMPGDHIRREFFSVKLKKANKKEIEKWVAASSGFSFAGLSDLVISVKCLGNTLEDAAETLRKLFSSSKNSEEYYTTKAGFSE